MPRFVAAIQIHARIGGKQLWGRSVRLQRNGGPYGVVAGMLCLLRGYGAGRAGFERLRKPVNPIEEQARDSIDRGGLSDAVWASGPEIPAGGLTKSKSDLVSLPTLFEAASFFPEPFRPS